MSTAADARTCPRRWSSPPNRSWRRPCCTARCRPGVLRDENCLGEPVQPVQIDVGHDGRRHPALRTAAERGVVLPVLQVPGLQHVAHQPQEPVVVDVLGQDRQHHIVVEAAEAVGDVTLDEPGRPGPVVGHLGQRRVAAPAGTETVRAGREQSRAQLAGVPHNHESAAGQVGYFAGQDCGCGQLGGPRGEVAGAGNVICHVHGRFGPERGVRRGRWRPVVADRRRSPGRRRRWTVPGISSPGSAIRTATLSRLPRSSPGRGTHPSGGTTP
jgi:hypothetical protein